MVDSCAWFTIMSKEKFTKLWPKRSLLLSDVNPGSYTRHKIPIVGYAHVQISFRLNYCNGKLYVAEKGQCILVWPYIVDLGIKLDPSGDPPVDVVQEMHDGHLEYDELNKKFPGAFSKSLGMGQVEVEQGMITEEEREQEMMKDAEMQMIKKL
ncbi:hypothetical protein NDU88_009081 [Pleurodeles waltl]|uniref:Uncharacterized protein n=1 Tax=Pleurodeles waltl TaxID=8319 RepID=A0AAV7QWK6_PLEWA|nr:hypothetical protein NDU88_009081 [Pleurodeles waltl]